MAIAGAGILSEETASFQRLYDSSVAFNYIARQRRFSRDGPPEFNNLLIQYSSNSCAL